MPVSDEFSTNTMRYSYEIAVNNKRFHTDVLFLSVNVPLNKPVSNKKDYSKQDNRRLNAKSVLTTFLIKNYSKTIKLMSVSTLQ